MHLGKLQGRNLKLDQQILWLTILWYGDGFRWVDHGTMAPDLRSVSGFFFVQRGSSVSEKGQFSLKNWKSTVFVRYPELQWDLVSIFRFPPPPSPPVTKSWIRYCCDIIRSYSMRRCDLKMDWFLDIITLAWLMMLNVLVLMVLKCYKLKLTFSSKNLFNMGSQSPFTILSQKVCMWWGKIHRVTHIIKILELWL